MGGEGGGCGAILKSLHGDEAGESVCSSVVDGGCEISTQRWDHRHTHTHTYKGPRAQSTLLLLFIRFNHSWNRHITYWVCTHHMTTDGADSWWWCDVLFRKLLHTVGCRLPSVCVYQMSVGNFQARRRDFGEKIRLLAFKNLRISISRAFPRPSYIFEGKKRFNKVFVGRLMQSDELSWLFNGKVGVSSVLFCVADLLVRRYSSV